MENLTHRVDLLVLDYLLAKRGLPTETALKFGELLPQGTVETLAGPSQARLMLRLLLDGHKTLSEDTLTCLGMLANVDVRDVTASSVAPPAELVAQVGSLCAKQQLFVGQQMPSEETAGFSTY